MKVLWTFIKVVIALAVAIPLSIILLGTALGILGALIGVAVVALKIAVLAFIGVAVFRLIGRLLTGSRPREPKTINSSLPHVDPHYEAAMRELDRELGVSR